MVPAAVPAVAVRVSARVASVAVVGASEVGNQLVLDRPSCTWVEDCCMKSYNHTQTRQLSGFTFLNYGTFFC